jgi:RNA polymerase sigma factor (sigma-70 family)
MSLSQTPVAPWVMDLQNDTPAWLQGHGIAGNEERFMHTFLPMAREWATAELGRVGHLGRLDPEDFAQNVLLKIFVRFREEPFARESGSGGFRAYLRRSVKHAVIDALRTSNAAYQAVQQQSDFWAGVNAGIDSLTERFGTAWSHDMARVREAVTRVQKRVGPERWEAFQLVVVEGCKGAEAAARLGLTPSQVYNAKHDITAYLREELTALGYEG